MDPRDEARLALGPSPSRRTSGPRSPAEGETLSEFLRSTAESADVARDLALGTRHSIASAQGSSSLTMSNGTQLPDSHNHGRKRELSRSASSPRRDAPSLPHTPSRNPDHSSLPRPEPGTESDPIDLTTPPHPAPAYRPSRVSSTNSIRIPRWQPNEEATSCTSCYTPFSWYFRKHHCRKCGKVVCANCSTHRITIPKQYIVNPPSDPSQSRPRPLSLGLPFELVRQESDLSGGETVRVCNPCVPDPNFLPPPQQAADPRQDPDYLRMIASMRPRLDQPPGYEEAAASSGMPARVSTVSAQRPQSRTRSSTQATPGYPSHDTGSPRARYMPIMRGETNRDQDAPQGRSAPAGRYTPARLHHRRPDRVVREEDQCPICSRELPAYDPVTGSDEARSGHIQRCIRRAERRVSRQLAAQIADSAGEGQSDNAPNEPHPAEQHQENTSLLQDLGALLNGARAVIEPRQRRQDAASPAALPLPPPPPPPPRLTDMLRFKAGPHDVANNEEKGGPPQECIICLEEFEVGQELGRLDCLCKFHAVCLDAWWMRKGTSECPTHKSFWQEGEVDGR